MPKRKAAELTDSEAPEQLVVEVEQAGPMARVVGPHCPHCHVEMRPGSSPDLLFCPSCFRVHRP